MFLPATHALPHSLATWPSSVANSSAELVAFAQAKRTLLMPKLQRTDNGLLCNGMLIPLSHSPLTQRLFDAFLQADTPSLERDALIQIVYQRPANGTSSSRMRIADRQNLIKLISRARDMANACVNTADFRWIEWFPYDQHERSWSLFALTRAYLEAKEWQLLQTWQAPPHRQS